MFNVGDKVVCTQGWLAGYHDDFSDLVEGETYTVLDTSVNGTVALCENMGSDGRTVWWNANRFESIVIDPLEEFKKALDNLRAAGYDVSVTLTKTVTEEL